LADLDIINKLLKECWDDKANAAKSTYEAVNSELASTDPIKLTATRNAILIVALKHAKNSTA
jgi:hypothetical protein